MHKKSKKKTFWILTLLAVLIRSKRMYTLDLDKMFFFWLYAKLVFDGINFDELNIRYMAKLI